MLDEDASTSFISLSCWRDIGSLKINRSPTTLKAFNGHDFQPHGLLPSLLVDLGGKSISIKLEFVYALDYNLLLCRNWFCTMQAVSSSVFQLVQFPFQGNIVTIHQLELCSQDMSSNSVNNVPLLDSTTSQY